MYLIIYIKKLITHAIELFILLKIKIDNYFESHICHTIINNLLIFLKQLISGPHSAMDTSILSKSEH